MSSSEMEGLLQAARSLGDDEFAQMIEARRPKERDLISIEDLAVERGKSVRTLRRWNKRPDAPKRVKWGKKRMYKRGDVARWLDSPDGPLKDEDER
jgi:hypothetical protein